MEKQYSKSKTLLTEKGFSIMETILSVFILGVIMLAVIQLINVSLRDIMDTRKNFVAAQLAQEGVEMVRNVRDNNLVGGCSNCAFDDLSEGTYRTSYKDTNDLDTGDYALRYDGNFYNHTSGSTTEYKRKIIIENMDGGEARKVSSVVTWKGQSFPGNLSQCTVNNRCIYAETILTKWGEE